MGEPAIDESKASKAKRRFLGVWTLVGALLLVGALVYLLNLLSVPVGIVIWAVVIIFCLRGPVNKLEKMGLNRTVGTAIAYVLMFVVIGVVGLLLFFPAFGIGGQFTSLVESIPTYVQNIIDWGNGIYTKYAYVFEDATVRQWIDEAQKALTSWAASFASMSASGVMAAGSAIMNSFVAIGFAFVVAFWILMQLPALGRECQRLAGPKHEEDIRMLHLTVTRVMGGYIKGTLLQCAIIGVACGVLFAIVGIPNYAALGGIAGLLNIIPIIGPWFGGALAAIVGIFVSPWVALIALIGTIAIQQFVYTFVSPKIMANSVDIHPAIMLISLMAGSAIGGAMGGLMGSLVGMLASIPVIAVAKSVFVYYFEKNTGRRLVSEDGVFFLGTPASGDVLDPIADATSPHPGMSSVQERMGQRKAEAKARAKRPECCEGGGEGKGEEPREGARGSGKEEP